MVEDIELVKRPGMAPAHKSAAWERILQAQQHSGLTAKAFASQHGLHADAIYRWREKFKRPSAAASPGFVEFQTPTPPEPGGCALEVHNDQLRVLVHKGCDPQLLRALISILQERSC
jgi:hypothetical protein